MNIEYEVSQRIVNWISDLNFWPKHNEIYERGCKYARESLLPEGVFRRWLNEDVHFLWCSGYRKTLKVMKAYA